VSAGPRPLLRARSCAGERICAALAAAAAAPDGGAPAQGTEPTANLLRVVVGAQTCAAPAAAVVCAADVPGTLLG
jgi:hypothetical protein